MAFIIFSHCQTLCEMCGSYNFKRKYFKFKSAIERKSSYSSCRFSAMFTTFQDIPVLQYHICGLNLFFKLKNISLSDTCMLAKHDVKRDVCVFQVPYIAVSSILSKEKKNY